MGRTLLFLVDRHGRVLQPELRSAVESAFRWASNDYPHIDSALLATWAEQLGVSMADKGTGIQSPRRYAFAALQGKVREHLRAGGTREVAVGIGEELEAWVGSDASVVRFVERQVLFAEIRAQLNERDRLILTLLLGDETSPSSIGRALGISYNAAAKAIQRLKERIHSILSGRPSQKDSQEYGDHD